MLLAIDIGNTNIVLGVFAGDRLVNSWRLATHRERTADEIGILVTHLFEHRQFTVDEVEGIVLASVVPPLTGTMMEMARRYFHQQPLLVEIGIDIGIPVLYENPAEVGADRLVNAVAAYHLYGRDPARPVIVVDFGTATTFDTISARGEYLGGVICPGIQISADALFQRAARLPRVEVRKPSRLIGRTTVGSIQSGLFFGYVAMVEGIVHRISRELAGTNGSPGASETVVPCVATGGMAEIIAPETPTIHEVNGELTLHGLRMVWARTRAT